MNYETSESVKAIAGALIAAQGAVEAAAKSAENPHFKNKFAPLDEIWKAAKPALQANNLAVLQHPVNSEGGVPGLRTVIWHDSGEWIASTIYCAPDKPTAQAIGSLITYLRRYSLQSVMGICAEDDDDGNAASAPAKTEKTKAAAELTPEEVDKFEAEIHFAEAPETLKEIAADLRKRNPPKGDAGRARIIELLKTAGERMKAAA